MQNQSLSHPAGPRPQPAKARRWSEGATLYFGTLALALIALPGLTGCADMSGIASRAQLRDAASVGLSAPAPGTLQVDAAVPTDWWKSFGDVQLDTLMQQALGAVRNDYSLARMYAMGVDAWSLANHFSQMRQVQGFEINGNTGALTATQDCVINRKLSWLKYQQGQIVPAS